MLEEALRLSLEESRETASNKLAEDKFMKTACELLEDLIFRITSKHLKRRDVDHDGNCYPKSIAAAYNAGGGQDKKKTTHGELRDVVLPFLNEDKDKRYSVVYGPPKSCKTAKGESIWEDYHAQVDRVAIRDEFWEDNQVLAAGDSLMRSIIIYHLIPSNENRDVCYVHITEMKPLHDNGEEPLNLVLYANEHSAWHCEPLIHCTSEENYEKEMATTSSITLIQTEKRSIVGSLDIEDSSIDMNSNDLSRKRANNEVPPPMVPDSDSKNKDSDDDDSSSKERKSGESPKPLSGSERNRNPYDEANKDMNGESEFEDSERHQCTDDRTSNEELILDELIHTVNDDGDWLNAVLDLEKNNAETAGKIFSEVRLQYLDEIHAKISELEDVAASDGNLAQWFLDLKKGDAFAENLLTREIRASAAESNSLAFKSTLFCSFPPPIYVVNFYLVILKTNLFFINAHH